MLIYLLKTFQEKIPCNDNSQCHLNVNCTHEKAKLHTARLRQCSGWAAPHYRACRDAVAWAVNTVLWHSFARTCNLCCPVLWCNNVSSLSFLNCSNLGNSPALAFKKLPSSPSLLSFPPAMFLPLSHNKNNMDCWIVFIYQTIRWNTMVYHTG